MRSSLSQDIADPRQLALAFVERVAGLRSPAVVAEHFQKLVQRLGWSNVVCVQFDEMGAPDPGSLLMCTRPEAWVREYVARGYFHVDPICRALARTDVPFTWAEAVGGRRLDPEEEEVMQHAAGYGMDCGFVVPIFDAGGEFGVVSIGGKGKAPCRAERTALTMAATLAHCRLSVLAARARERAIGLTERERECLMWIAEGKSDWQIGRILDISAKTVNYHVENVKRKLGVATRVQAVVMALRHARSGPARGERPVAADATRIALNRS
ncbi:MAG: autoinducer binding domain-containing protein [Hyphomicrobiaceae bacterium]|nr:autoinducer binding domain-containing protein [Hyphomicrobiaceae bacterium]